MKSLHSLAELIQRGKDKTKFQIDPLSKEYIDQHVKMLKC